MTNDGHFRSMLRRAEKAGENVVFVLMEDALFEGWCACYKVPVPGELDRDKHFVASFMHLSEFHGYFHGPFELCDQRTWTLYKEVPMEFHKTRRMFAYDGSCLFVALEGDVRSHEEWFAEVRLDIEKHTRGFVRPGLICLYRGSDFSVPEDYKQVLRAVSHLAKDYPVGLGMKVGQPGVEWEPLIQFANASEALACSTTSFHTSSPTTKPSFATTSPG